jgi:hypothetical protein
MYAILCNIGINMRELDKRDPSVQYLRELYAFLLYRQLLAWKEGRSPRGIVRAFNRDIKSKPVQT